MERLSHLLFAAALAALLPAIAWSQGGPPDGGGEPAGDCDGWVDENGDGVCDNCDRIDEDGIPDRDRDRDCDPAQDCEEFVDEDGDGLCDLCGRDHESGRERAREELHSKNDCPGYCDGDGDGRCDNCGGAPDPEQEPDDKGGPNGDGCPGFVDEDGDGLCDNCGCEHDPEQEQEREREQEQNGDGCPGFIDEDGDGVCDNCGDHEANGTEERKRFRRGDADQNGNANLSDAVFMLRALFRNGPLGCPDAADANDDGRVDISDAVALLRHLFQNQNGPGMPAPCRNPGEDPTPDGLGCD